MIKAREETEAVNRDLIKARVKDGHMQRMTDLAQRAAEHHQDLSQRLLRLIDHYDYDALSRLFFLHINDAGKKDS